MGLWSNDYGRILLVVGLMTGILSTRKVQDNEKMTAAKGVIFCPTIRSNTTETQCCKWCIWPSVVHDKVSSMNMTRNVTI